MNAAKILLPVLLLAGGTGGYFLLQSSEQSPVAPTPIKVEPAPEKPKEEPKPEAAPSTQSQPDRKEVVLTNENSNAAEKQGVMGRVLLPSGAPAPGVPVYLMKSAAADPVGNWLANRAGQVVPPVASGQTSGDGTFHLGTARTGEELDLRIVASEFPERSYRSIKLHDEEWYDIKDLKLELGSVVQGRVTEEGTGAAIAGATVYLSATNDTLQMLATPGRERGLAAQVDATGFYRFANAPKQGSVTLIAEAEGYARVEKSNLLLTNENMTEFQLEMARGLPIKGIVVDNKGAPVGNARVTATAISAKVPQTGQGNTRRDGTFEIQALREGPYQLTTSAPQYEEKTDKNIFAGADDVRIVLDTRGMAKVRVLSRQGAPVKNYTLQLKRHFPQNPLGIGNVPEFKDLRITPGDYPQEFAGNWALIRGIPNGEFVFQITANNHAKTLSPSFLIATGGAVPEVEVLLTLGGELTGRVVDDRGAPVAGAKVSTDINGGFAADTDFGAIFRQFMPDRHTAASANTNADGVYRLPMLAFGEYMLRAQHGDYCEGAAVDLKLEQEGNVQVPDIVLIKGAILEGLASVNGQPTGQVKVVVGPPQGQAPELDERGRPKSMFTATAISESDGHFRFLKRVPPGTYQIHAAKAAGDNNPFGLLLQMKQTQRPLQVVVGQQKIVQNFDIPAQ